MPRPVPLPVRQVIYRRIQQEDDVSSIAEELRLPVRTVRNLVRRFREDETNLRPGYVHGGRSRSAAIPPLIGRALAMRAQHAGWGAGLIRVLLKEDHPHEAVPSERTLRRWLSRLGGEPAPPGRRPTTNSARAGHPHEVWQMDAADQKRLQTGQMISWLRAVDECSGAVLKTVVFSRGKLQSGPSAAGPGGFARVVRPLGVAGTFPRGQRLALGFLG